MTTKWTLWLALLCVCIPHLQAADTINLQANRNGGGHDLKITSKLGLPVSSQYPEYNIFQSAVRTICYLAPSWNGISSPF